MGPSGQSSSQTQTKALYLSLSAGSVLHTSFPKAALTKIKRREQSLALTALGAPQGKGSLSMSIGTGGERAMSPLCDGGTQCPEDIDD